MGERLGAMLVKDYGIAAEFVIARPVIAGLLVLAVLGVAVRLFL